MTQGDAPDRIAVANGDAVLRRVKHRSVGIASYGGQLRPTMTKGKVQK